MECSQYRKWKVPCEGKGPSQLSDIINSGLIKVMADNKLPEELASKISILLSEGLDASDFCNKIVVQQSNALKPKVRILDRAIVYKFEQYYDELNEVLKNRSPSTIDIGDFFHAIPRGECLDAFLVIIKSHCIGGKAQKEFESKLTCLTNKYIEDEIINWQGVYESKEYELYMDEFFSIFFNRIKDHAIPVPALNNQLAEFHKPKRINKVLKYMSKLWDLRERPD